METMSAAIRDDMMPADDRRPLEVEVESLAKAVAVLDESTVSLSDRLQPLLSNRPVLSAERDGRATTEDGRSPLVRQLDELHEHVQRITERVEALYQRVDC